MTSDSADLPVIYWTPHCSSCMAVKHFFAQRNIPHRSINVAADPDAFSRLSELGIASVPVVVQGDRYVFAQYLTDVADFLGLNEQPSGARGREPLSVRLVQLLDIARDILQRCPEDLLARDLPGRPRSFFVVAHHVFQIADAAGSGFATGKLHDRDSLAEPPDEMNSKKLLEQFADGVIARLHDSGIDGPEKIETDYGTREFEDVLHRVVSHAAQHLRQLHAFVGANAGELPALPSELFEGLTIAEASFDAAGDLLGPASVSSTR